ncbi:MAG TPA: PorV/PorQ family protein [Candidatus Eisenbacteria bacterium]|jgi:hypothetical protein
MRAVKVIGGAMLGIYVAAAGWAQGLGRSLDIQPGARENGMGAAGVALPGDPCEATWWNPAALGFAEHYGVQWTSADLAPQFDADIRYHHVVGAVPIQRLGAIGVGGTFLSYGKGSDAREWSTSVSAGYRLLPDLAVGVTAKYIRFELAPGPYGEASTFGFDLGGLYRKPVASMTLSLGLNVQNIGPEATFSSEDSGDPLGRNLKVGGAISLQVPLGPAGFEVGGTGAMDFNESLVTNDFRTWNEGMEVYGAYAKWVRVMLRGGYYNDDLGEIRDFTYGAGIRVVGLSFDAAWIPQARVIADDVMKMTIGLHTDFLMSLLSAN